MSGAADEGLQFRPHPELLVPKDEEEDGKVAAADDESDIEDDMEKGDAKDEEDEEDDQPKKYRAPKMAAAVFDTEAEKESKRDHRERRRMMQSTVLKEMRLSLADEPEEIGVDGLAEVRGLTTSKRRKREEEDSAQRAMEEELFVRYVFGLLTRSHAGCRRAARRTGSATMT